MPDWLGGNALLALVAAGFWGIGDFSGGMGVKTAGGSVGAALRVVILSHLTSFSVLLIAAYALGDPFPHGRLLAWGLAAGVAGGTSLSAFYIALSRGAMGASAAISFAVTGAVLEDFVQGSLNEDLKGCTLTAYVPVANTVTAVIANATGSTVTFAATTLTVRVTAE